MRNPVRSEADAFHIVAGSTVVLAAAVALGALLAPLVGVALVVGAVAGVDGCDCETAGAKPVAHVAGVGNAAAEHESAGAGVPGPGAPQWRRPIRQL